MLKKVFIVMAFLLLCVPVQAQTVKFEPFPTLVKKDGQQYSGILLSEGEFRSIIEMKIKLDYFMHLSGALSNQLQASNMQFDNTLAAFDKLTDKIKGEIDNESWWEQNKGVMGVVIGLITGIGLSVGVFYAVK
jgi:hypothetical protein